MCSQPRPQVLQRGQEPPCIRGETRWRGWGVRVAHPPFCLFKTQQVMAWGTLATRQSRRETFAGQAGASGASARPSAGERRRLPHNWFKSPWLQNPGYLSALSELRFPHLRSGPLRSLQEGSNEDSVRERTLGHQSYGYSRWSLGQHQARSRKQAEGPWPLSHHSGLTSTHGWG